MSVLPVCNVCKYTARVFVRAYVAEGDLALRFDEAGEFQECDFGDAAISALNHHVFCEHCFSERTDLEHLSWPDSGGDDDKVVPILPTGAGAN